MSKDRVSMLESYIKEVKTYIKHNDALLVKMGDAYKRIFIKLDNQEKLILQLQLEIQTLQKEVDELREDKEADLKQELREFSV